ncbi:unnamed protein product [Symbiodinium natans]|uniref:Nucleoside 2-deoxyribosyltransferase n=1 Tax=Symbiodinium natans TaxID=878477 RepID=A0A812I507_9DINO|nr:unnamed protein product [Symbiodinium natans]
MANFNSIRERFGGRSVGHTVVVQAPQEEHTSGYTPGPSAALSTPRQPAQRRHLLISGRFNSQEKLSYMRSVKRVLDSEGVPVCMVQTRGPGDSFGNLTELGLYRALGLIAFCTDDYGAVTGAQYETFVELRYAHQNKLPIIPVQLCDTFPPEPPDEEGRAQNHLVLRRDIDRITDIGMGEPERVARKILRAWNGLQEPPRPG